MSEEGGRVIEGVEAMGEGTGGARLSAGEAAACREDGSGADCEPSSEGKFDGSWELSIL